MKREQTFAFIAGVMLLAAAVTLLGGYRGGDYRLTAIIAAGIDTDGTVATVTLSEASPDCTFINRDSTATNTLDLTINGDADTIRLYGGDTYHTASSGIPIWVSTFSSAAVVGTPDIQYFCFGR